MPQEIRLELAGVLRDAYNARGSTIPGELACQEPVASLRCYVVFGLVFG